MKFMTKLLLLGGLGGSLAGSITGQARAQQAGKSHGETFTLNDTQMTVQRSVLSEFYTLDQDQDVSKNENGTYQINLRRGNSTMILFADDKDKNKHITAAEIASETLIWYGHDGKHAIHLAYDMTQIIQGKAHPILWAGRLLNDKPVRRLLGTYPYHAHDIKKLEREVEQRFHGHDPATNHLQQIDIAGGEAIRLQKMFLSEKYKLTEACQSGDDQELVYQSVDKVGNKTITIRAHNQDDGLVLSPYEIKSISLSETSQNQTVTETMIAGSGLGDMNRATIRTTDPKTGRTKVERYFRDNNPGKMDELTQKVLREFDNKPN